MINSLKRYLNKHLVLYLFKKSRYSDFVIYNDWVGYNIIVNGIYEKYELEVLLNSISKNTLDGTALDIGANIGNHTVFLSSHFQKVQSFEPQIRTFELLKMNTEGISNVSVYNYGIASITSKVDFFIPNRNNGAASANKVNRPHRLETVNMSSSLSDVEESKVSLVKIDVEGNESDVIVALEKLIDKCKPIICFELNKDSKHTVVELLRSLGYVKFYTIESCKRFNFRKKMDSMQFIEQFDNKDYSLIACYHPDSKFRIVS